jgi:hypothetical protein
MFDIFFGISVELGNKLAALGFRRLESDWGLYVKPQTQEKDPVLILVYMDDSVIAARTTTLIQDSLKKLKVSGSYRKWRRLSPSWG